MFIGGEASRRRLKSSPIDLSYRKYPATLPRGFVLRHFLIQVIPDHAVVGTASEQMALE
jgi:hypothetical protein